VSYKHIVNISLVLGLTEPFDLEWVDYLRRHFVPFSI
jgi:hypothetical protein